MVKVMSKFGIQVSLGQCRRAKKYALKLIEGSLVEHYGKIWSYGYEILRTNPGSTVKLDVDTSLDGNKYSSKFYVFLRSETRLERRIIGLDGYFMKRVCKGEFICIVRKDVDD